MSDSRGSQLLWDRWQKRFDQKHLDTVLSTLKKNDFVIEKVFCKGEPAPDLFEGHVRVSPESLDHFTNVIQKLPGSNVAHLEFFPYGIIDPEWFMAKFSLTPGA
ncbi:MAG: hypothetical protein AAF682_01890 [Planctomycetota bacterium]